MAQSPVVAAIGAGDPEHSCIGGATGLSLLQHDRRGHCPKTRGFNRLFQDCSDQVALLHSSRHSALKKAVLAGPGLHCPDVQNHLSARASITPPMSLQVL